MKFEFPKDKKTETLNVSIYLSDINKVRSLAKKYNCTINDIYKTLISEALEEYEKQFGIINETKSTPQYSVKRDYLEAEDNKRKEILDGEPFDGGGDRRTKEAKEEKIVSPHAISIEKKTKVYEERQDKRIKGLLRTCNFIGCKLEAGKFIENENSKQVMIGKETYYFCSEYCMNGFVNPKSHKVSWSTNN